MRSLYFSRFIFVVGLMAAIAGRQTAVALDQSPQSSVTSTNAYEDQLVQANLLFKRGALDDALAAIEAARKLDPKRFEAPATAALILHAAGKDAEAKAAVNEALKLAPPDKADKIQNIAKLIASPTQAAPGKSKSPASADAPQLSAEARRQLDVLKLIIEDADKATLADERKRLLREFMAKSADFLVDNSSLADVWVLRAAVALELDYPTSGWLAGRKLTELGLDTSDDPKTRNVLAMLERRDWLRQRHGRDWSKWTTDQVQQAADEGDEEAQDALGDWYSEGGSRLVKDETKAIEWYQKAAIQGQAFAQDRLGASYATGRGVPKDEAQAVTWFRKAAELECESAQYNLGRQYQLGRGVPEDKAQAVTWFRKAAELGHARAQGELGFLYSHGAAGVAKDLKTAVTWYRKSAEQGNMDSEMSLALILASSPDENVRNGKEAVTWATKLCESARLKEKYKHYYKNCLLILAAAHAEAGDFDQAVEKIEMAMQGLDQITDAQFIKALEKRRKQYEAHQPYRTK